MPLTRLNLVQPLAEIKNYAVVRKLGSGGMAEVYLAIQQGAGGLRRPAVLKRIHPHLAGDPDFVALFLREAATAASLTHPNIVHMYELLEGESGEYFIAMEYVRGESLLSLVRAASRRQSRIPFWVVAHVGARICDALDYAYNVLGPDGEPLHVVHRDVSPANILVSAEGQVKLVDFGIAKPNDAGGITRAGPIKGKYAYMSPEQLRGEELDDRSDIFSLGVVLYEMITAQRLFRGDNEAAVAQALLEDTIPGLASNSEGQLLASIDAAGPMLAADCPRGLERVIMTCLARERGGRFTNAAALRRALDEFSRSEGYAVTPTMLAEFMGEMFPALRELDAALTPSPPSVRPVSAPPVERSGVSPKLSVGAAATVEPPPVAPADPSRGATVTTRPAADRTLVILVIAALVLSVGFWLLVYPRL